MRVVRPFANRVFNPIVRPFVAWIPGFALVVHRGRRTGRLHRTPMMVFRRGEDTVFDVASGAVGLGEVSSEVSGDIIAQVNEVQEQIASGELTDIPETVE